MSFIVNQPFRPCNYKCVEKLELTLEANVSVVSVDVIESNVKLLLIIYECRSLLKFICEITVLVMNFQLPNLAHEKSHPNLICNLIKLL